MAYGFSGGHPSAISFGYYSVLSAIQVAEGIGMDQQSALFCGDPKIWTAFLTTLAMIYSDNIMTNIDLA